MGKDFNVVKVTEPESFKQLELLQKEVWGGSDVIPYHVLIAFQKMGGVVLAAYDERDRPVGMLCGYNSTRNGEPFFYMHLCGVVPDMRNHGVATMLKVRLRELLLEEGIRLARWLLDPLQIPEAYLSIHRLGAVGRRYEENFYGLMRDPYNRGLESDRLEVEWRIDSQRVEDRLSHNHENSVEKLLSEGARNIIKTVNVGSVKKVLDYRLNVKSSKILVEVPGNMDDIKRLDLSTAIEWRRITRKIFKKYLSENYMVTDLLPGGNSYFYLLERLE